MFLVVVQKQHQYVTGHAGVWAVSSKTSDWLQKRPDDHMSSIRTDYSASKRIFGTALLLTRHNTLSWYLTLPKIGVPASEG